MIKGIITLQVKGKGITAAAAIPWFGRCCVFVKCFVITDVPWRETGTEGVYLVVYCGILFSLKQVKVRSLKHCSETLLTD